MRTTKKKTIAIVAASIVLVAGGGAAFAYWTAGGSGTGSATTSTGTQAVTAVQTSVVTDLRPGAAAQGLSGTFNNPNTEPVYVTSVTASIAGVVDGSAQPIVGCSAADYTLLNAVMAVNSEVLVNDTSTWSGATIQFNNTAANQDACKGATVNLAYAVL